MGEHASSGETPAAGVAGSTSERRSPASSSADGEGWARAGAGQAEIEVAHGAHRRNHETARTLRLGRRSRRRRRPHHRLRARRHRRVGESHLLVEAEPPLVVRVPRGRGAPGRSTERLRRRSGNTPSTASAMKTTSNSRPLAWWRVVRVRRSSSGSCRRRGGASPRSRPGSRGWRTRGGSSRDLVPPAARAPGRGRPTPLDSSRRRRDRRRAGRSRRGSSTGARSPRPPRRSVAQPGSASRAASPAVSGRAARTSGQPSPGTPAVPLELSLGGEREAVEGPEEDGAHEVVGRPRERIREAAAARAVSRTTRTAGWSTRRMSGVSWRYPPPVERPRELGEEAALRADEDRHARQGETVFEVEALDLGGDPLGLRRLLVEDVALDAARMAAGTTGPAPPGRRPGPVMRRAPSRTAAGHPERCREDDAAGGRTRPGLGTVRGSRRRCRDRRPGSRRSTGTGRRPR